MDRFIVKPSQSGKWELYDRDSEIVVVWEAGRFNDTQKITFLKGSSSNPLQIARMMREIGDYLAENHREIV